jgi:REP element-mobilizing transposase RayT
VVKNSQVILTNYGKIVDNVWSAIPEHFANVNLDEYIIMPNHLHGILIIFKCLDKTYDKSNESNLNSKDEAQFGKPIPASLGTIIGSFKSAVTKRINGISDKVKISIWQRNYYEHIIRNEKDLFRIRQYIRQNPHKWELGKYNI